jgi:exodeoxyribonuclease VII large subunit
MRAVEARAQRLDDATRRLEAAMRLRALRFRSRLDSAGSHLRLLHPARRIREDQRRLTELDRRLARAVRQRTARARADLHGVAGRLEALGPKKVLARGYAIARDPQTGRVVRSWRDARKGAALTLTVDDGWVQAAVTGHGPDGTDPAGARSGPAPRGADNPEQGKLF